MYILLFLISLVLGGVAYNLWRPVYAPSGAATASFFFGLIGNLFALHLFLLCLLLLGLFAWFNTATNLIESIAVLVLLASGAAYLVFHLRGYNVQHTVEHALQEGLGESYRTGIAEDITAHFVHTINPKTMFWPFPQDLPGVEILKDIPYGEHSIQKLDIYRKQEHGQLRPVLVASCGPAKVQGLEA